MDVHKYIYNNFYVKVSVCVFTHTLSLKYNIQKYQKMVNYTLKHEKICLGK